MRKQEITNATSNSCPLLDLYIVYLPREMYPLLFNGKSFKRTTQFIMYKNRIKAYRHLLRLRTHVACGAYGVIKGQCE